MTAQQYQIEDCKHLHVVKYKVVDANIEDEIGPKDDNIVHDIRPLTPRSYYEKGNIDDSRTDQRDDEQNTLAVLGMVQTSNFSCAEINVNLGRPKCI